MAGKASARPSWPALTEAWSWIHGTRVAKLPVTAPCTAKTAATAYRALLICSMPKTGTAGSCVIRRALP